MAGPSFSGQTAKGAIAAISDGVNDTEEGEGESVFSKLEKTRTMLETTLGLASLLEAYTLIQVATLNHGCASDSDNNINHVLPI